MRPIALLIPLLVCGCPPRDDTGVDALSVRIDADIGSLVWVSWEQAEADTMVVEYSFDGGARTSTPQVELEPGPQQLPLLGIPFDAEVELVLHRVATFGAVETQTATIHTDPLPAGLPEPTLLAADSSLYDPTTPWLLTSIDKPGDVGTPEATWTIILDRDGRVVWALETPAFRLTMHPRISADGRAILMDLNSHMGTFDRGAASQVQRVGIDGGLQATWDTPGLHHPYTDLPDGSLAWGAWGDDLETLELLDPDGAQRTLWDCADYHAAQGMPETNCSSNTISWDPASERFLFSFYTTHTVVEIDGASGETTRWFGQMPGGWTFEPEDSAFVWQHGAYLTAEGTLLCSMRAPDGAEETVAREYRLDAHSETLQEIWSYGLGQDLFAPELGEAYRLPGGNTLLNYGSGTHIREVTPSGATAWELSFATGSLLGRSTPIDDLYALLPDGSR